MDEILKELEAERVSSKMSKTRNSGLYRLGLTKAIDIILERCERKEPAPEERGLSKHDVNQQRELLAIAALNKIAHPIKYLQDEAEKDGCRLDGYMATQLTKDANFYQEIAGKALKAIANCG